MRTLLLFSATRDEAEALANDGPRRDMFVVAERLGARILWRAAGGITSGPLRKLAGPHLRHAWDAARQARNFDVIIADGEHVGIPLLFFLAALRRQARLVIIGHLISSPWKRRALWLASRLGPPGGAVLLHGAEQAKVARATLPASWRAELMPYQADTSFWVEQREARTALSDALLVVAVGAEDRDYGTLFSAMDGMDDAHALVRPGSSWARRRDGSVGAPANVDLVTERLSFGQLRRWYDGAAIVVVPLHFAPNQSGVTSILEAMSMGKPVIVSASPGQQEVVAGPLVTADGIDAAATADRGPAKFGFPGSQDWTGFYVPVGDAPALRRAITLLAGDPDLRRRMGEAGRRAAVAWFDVEQFADRLAAVARSTAEQPAIERGVRRAYR